MWIRDLRRALAVSLAILMAVTTLPMGLAQAKMVTTDQVIEQSNPSGDREAWMITLSAIPEPSTFALASLGLLSLGMFGRRRRQR